MSSNERRGNHYIFVIFRGALIKVLMDLEGRSLEGSAHWRGALIRGNTVSSKIGT